MNYLDKILCEMKKKENTFEGDYYIPEKWNVFGFKNFKTSPKRKGEININPYEFFRFVSENSEKAENKTAAPLIYSVIPRSVTAWNHTESGEIQNGTFLKLITILPLLKKYGVTIIYLLPICSHGTMNMKGEMGSPYAIKDFYEIDEKLHDPLLGDYTPEMLHNEFAAFVESCHKFNIKVMLDFAFRTVSRDNCLVGKHPDWFYWIKKSADANFNPPELKNIDHQFSITLDNYKLLYESDELSSYVKNFSQPPNLLDPKKWEACVKSGKVSAEDIVENFGITTAPGFPDVVNDVQPAWTDATYLKYYFDYPKEVEKYIDKNLPPFIMQDGASLNVIHGEEKNTELWDYIADILPFYYKNYGIDGARIDMSHAMPPELNSEIISNIKKIAPNFILYSEEFNPNLSKQAKEDGFSLLSGFTYAVFKNAKEKGFNEELLCNNMLKTVIPITSAIETPDTPRSMQNFKNADFVKLLFIINSFLPMSYPMLNSGNELLEIQPMNLGLDNTEEGRFVLPKSDPMYGKLAFFDNYRLAWTVDSKKMEQAIFDIAKIRAENYETIKSRENFILNKDFIDCNLITVLPYFNSKTCEGLVVAANRSDKNRAVLSTEKLFDGFEYNNATVIYDSNGFCNKNLTRCKTVQINPNEAIIIKLTSKGE